MMVSFRALAGSVTRRWPMVLVLVLIFVATGCGSPGLAPAATVVALPPLAGSCGLGTFENDEAAIAALIQAEGSFVVAQEIAGLMALWDESGAVVEAAHTPDATADDQRWDGLDAIRHRYVWLVFPGAPAQASPGQMAVRIDGDTATVASTTQIGAEVSLGGDRWEVVRTPAGCWVIRQLSFNLEK